VRADIHASMIAIVEELSFKLKLEVENTPNDGENPSRSKVFKRLFLNLRVAGGGRSGSELNRHLKDGSCPSVDRFIKKTWATKLTEYSEPTVLNRVVEPESTSRRSMGKEIEKGRETHLSSHFVGAPWPKWVG